MIQSIKGTQSVTISTKTQQLSVVWTQCDGGTHIREARNSIKDSFDFSFSTQLHGTDYQEIKCPFCVQQMLNVLHVLVLHSIVVFLNSQKSKNMKQTDFMIQTTGGLSNCFLQSIDHFLVNKFSGPALIGIGW